MQKKFSAARWLDEFKLSFLGLKNVALRPRFFGPALIGFLIFGTILNLLAGGTASFALIGASNFGGKLEIIGGAFLKIFGINQTSFLDWAFTFLIAALQGILIGLVVFVYKARKSSANLQNAGIVAGLAILGSGCPTCGTTVLMPVIVSIAGSSSMAFASTVSWVLTAASIIVALLAFKKVGFETYAILEDEKYREAKAKLEALETEANTKQIAKKVRPAKGKQKKSPKNQK